MTSPREPTEIRLLVNRDRDVTVARLAGRTLAKRLGFKSGDATDIATVVSELARNIVIRGERGEITLTPVEKGSRCGLSITASDKGPGISDIDRALEAGYSTSGGLGLGLSSARLIMDEFGIVSEPGKGTVVTATKWLRR